MGTFRIHYQITESSDTVVNGNIDLRAKSANQANEIVRRQLLSDKNSGDDIVAYEVTSIRELF